MPRILSCPPYRCNFTEHGPPKQGNRKQRFLLFILLKWINHRLSPIYNETQALNGRGSKHHSVHWFCAKVHSGIVKPPRKVAVRRPYAMDLQSQGSGQRRGKVGIVYDERMRKHARPKGKPHPEQPDRIKVIWEKLKSAGVLERCVLVEAKEASDDQLATVHTRRHIELMRDISTPKYDRKRDGLAETYSSIYFNEGSSESAYLAAGSVLEISEKVALGELNAGVAIVRPPGHHAEADKAMGFCLFNNIAIAAQYLVHERPELGVCKVLIVDWDVHHGNGTQHMFWSDPQVLYFSVHRFDSGTFYPGGEDGFYDKIGEGPGAGYNINVPWEQGKCGDADYLAVWDHILIPVARSYNPDMVLISGGFDAALGDPLGGCRLTPYGYSLMTRKLMEIAGGKTVLALEGGYNLVSLADSFLACVEALLEAGPTRSSSVAHPFESTWRVIQAVRQELSSFWPVLNENLPLLKSVEDAAAYSLEEPSSSSSNEGSASERDEESTEEVKSRITSADNETSVHALDDLILPVADLKVNEGSLDEKGTSNCAVSVINHDETWQFQSLRRELAATIINEETNLLASGTEDMNESTIVSVASVVHDDTWRLILSSTYVWYASYGSNLWKARFLCYIQGGRVEGMANCCSGSEDKIPPQGTQYRVVPHRMFFGRSYSHSWGAGGLAFLHPKPNDDCQAHVCLYKITLKQFNDLLLQENGRSCKTKYPLVDLAAINLIRNENHVLEIIKDGWYGTILYLGTEEDLPILTFTCSFSDIEKFKLGQLPICPPSSRYANVLVRGLVEGSGLSADDAMAYISRASESPFA